MGVMADRLAAIVITASSPDGQIEAKLENDDEIEVSFQDGSYGDYTERGLEPQLTRLAMRLWASYQRAYDTTVAEVMGRQVERSRQSWDADRRRFREEQAETVCEGMSAQELVYMQTTGMVTWNVVVRDGTLAKLSEDEFLTELLSAYQALNHDYQAKMNELRIKHYGSVV